MQWYVADPLLLIISSLLIALQLCWIGLVLRRNHLRRLGLPLSAMAFQRELERIFQDPINRSET